MTDTTARTVANAMVTAAGVAAVVVIVATPRLRQLAFRAVRLWLGAGVPLYLAREARQAWVESGRAA